MNAIESGPHGRYLSSHVSSVLLLMLGVFGCGSARRHDGESILLTAGFDFENSSIDPVAVYLDVSHSEWLLGHVEPTRRARLRLPDYFTGRSHTTVNVIVVPLGSQRNGVFARDNLDAIWSEPVPIDELASMRWTLSGREVMSFIPPKKH